MNQESRQSDALVFFGATGDLAHKKIYPALQALARDGELDMPVIGVARAGWTVDQLRAHVRDSLGDSVDEAAFQRLSANLRYIDGDYKDPATFEKLKREPVTDHELQRAKNQFARDYIVGRESIQDKAMHLAHAAVIHNDITTADGEFEIFSNVTTADVQRVAKTYFNESNRLVLHVLPKGAGTR